MIKKFLHHFRKNIFESFWGKNLVWHFLAIAITYILVVSGFDWFYFGSTRSVFLFTFTFSAGIIGFFIPVLLPLFIYLHGKGKEKAKSSMIALGIVQAGIIGYLISIFYKTFTGRIQPDFETFSPVLDISRDFNFGFLQHGIFWGWPSSHTAVACALAAALFVCYPKNRVVRYPALLL